MKYIFLTLLLCGCATPAPIAPKWPDVPDSLTNKCGPLKLTPQTDKLSVVLDTVVDNYAAYHECALRVEGWNEWYTEQKKIYNELNK